MTTQLFFEIARWGVYFFMISSILIGLVKFKTIGKDQGALLYLVIIAFIVEIVSVFLWKMKVNNNFIFHFYSPIEFVFLASIYKSHLVGVVKPILMSVIIIVFVFFAFLNTVFFQDLSQFNTYVTFTECLLLIGLALLYYYTMLRDLQYRALERNPMFWINVSVLSYFSGALVLFHVANDLIPEPLKVRGAIWGVHAIFNIVHYLLYAIALSVKPEKSGNANSNTQPTILTH